MRRKASRLAAPARAHQLACLAHPLLGSAHRISCTVCPESCQRPTHTSPGRFACLWDGNRASEFDGLCLIDAASNTSRSATSRSNTGRSATGRNDIGRNDIGHGIVSHGTRWRRGLCHDWLDDIGRSYGCELTGVRVTARLGGCAQIERLSFHSGRPASLARRSRLRGIRTDVSAFVALTTIACCGPPREQ